MMLELERPAARKGYYAPIPGLPELRPYQAEAFGAIADSIINRRGLTFTVVMARQSGKNELSAQLELVMLTKHARVAADAIKCAPTFAPQGYVSFRRLRDRIAQAGMAEMFRQEPGPALRIERARQLFLSANDASNVVGHTAGIMLEVDEAQDVSPEKFERDFRPMAASTGATIVYYGTPWEDFSLLAQAVERNRELERRDGVRRHFEADWTALAALDPVYAGYVESERERLGENHPLFQTQYALRTVSGGGRLFSGSQRAQLQGAHARQSVPMAGEMYVAGLDIGGQAAEEQGARSGEQGRGHDATVLTIARVVPPVAEAIVQEPRLEVVEHLTFSGEPHDAVLARLSDVLGRVWRVRRVAVDATGLGETLARLLSRSLGSEVVRAVKFTAESKSRLGFRLLAAVNGGRLRMYTADGSEEYGAFWQEIERARVAYRANQTMNFFVDEREGRDDYLVSLGLAAEAADGLESRPRVARGRFRAGFGEWN
jgi:hypothetical protein